MDSQEEARSYDAMDHATVNAAFVQQAIALWGGRPPPEVLDLGTGTAQIPIALARSTNVKRIVGIDLAAQMLLVGRENLKSAGLSGVIELLHGDCKALDYDAATFDLILSNSLVHHLPDPTPMLREARRLVRPGGAILVRDLTRPHSLATVSELVDTYAANADEMQRELFRASLCAALTLDEVSAVAKSAGLESARVYQSSDRHFTLELQHVC